MLYCICLSSIAGAGYSSPFPSHQGVHTRWFGRALEWHSRGQRFDPAYLHQKLERVRKTLKSSDFKVFSFPKVENSGDLQKAPVRLIFDGNFENQEVRYDEENQDELHRHIGRNLCGFSPFPQGKRACGKDAGKLFLPMESRGAALGHGDGHCRPPKGRLGRYDCFHAGRWAFAQQYQQLHAGSEILFLLVQRAGADPFEYPPVQG